MMSKKKGIPTSPTLTHYRYTEEGYTRNTYSDTGNRWELSDENSEAGRSVTLSISTGWIIPGRLQPKVIISWQQATTLDDNQDLPYKCSVTLPGGQPISTPYNPGQGINIPELSEYGLETQIPTLDLAKL